MRVTLLAALLAASAHATHGRALFPLLWRVRADALAPPRLAAPASATALSLAWDALPSDSGVTYTLLADDWWAAAGSKDVPAPSRAVYTGADTAAVLTARVVPGAPVTLLLVAADTASGAELARSAAVTFMPLDAGGCGNLADATVWRDNQAHLYADVQSCMSSCELSGGDCAAGCVRKHDAFTAPCAACFGDYFECVKKHCSLPCGISPGGSKCASCAETACQPSAVRCSGMPDWAWD